MLPRRLCLWVVLSASLVSSSGSASSPHSAGLPWLWWPPPLSGGQSGGQSGTTFSEPPWSPDLRDVLASGGEAGGQDTPGPLLVTSEKETEMAYKRMTREQVNAALEVALSAAEAHQDGRDHLTIHGVDFDLHRGGRCAEFVRESEEVGQGLDPYTWRFRAATANEMIEKLRKAGLGRGEGDDPHPGDVMGYHEGAYGHVWLFAGDWYGDGREDLCVENTSSRGRGDPDEPGTKVTRLADIVAAHGGRAPDVFRLGP